MWSVLRRNRDFRRAFVAQVIDYAGDWFATVAMLGLVLDRTGSALGATAVFVAGALPGFLLAPIAGPVVDRWNRKSILVTTAGCQMLSALLFLLAVNGPVWFVFVAQALIASFAAFFGPASQAAIPNLVGEADLRHATALMSATWGTMLAVGAGLGGLFTAAFGRTAAFVADASSFAVAGLLIASIRRPLSAHEAASSDALARPRMRPITDARDGLRFARRTPEVIALLASKSGFGLASGLVGMLAVLGTEHFGAGDGGTGYLLAMRGLGVVIGPLIASRFIDREIGPVLFVCGISAIVNGASYTMTAWSPTLAFAGVFVLLAHLGGGSQWTLSTYGLQLATPDEFRGRIFATDFALVTLTMSISLIAAGLLADPLGPRPVMTGLALVSLTWGAAYLVLTRRYWRATVNSRIPEA